MHIHYLQHVAFEAPAAILDWAKDSGHTVSSTHIYRGDPLPERPDFDLLVVMGGPMSVNEEKEYPWLVKEKRLLGATINAGRAVLGICLGAQMIANVLGARVYQGTEKEIGWFPVRRVTNERLGALLPEAFTPLHWHGETFDLPAGAVRLAETSTTPNQAFQSGPNVVGLQFHLEATVNSVDALLENAAGDIQQGRPFQQYPDTIRARTSEASASMRPILHNILAHISRTNPIT